MSAALVVVFVVIVLVVRARRRRAGSNLPVDRPVRVRDPLAPRFGRRK